MEKIFIKNRDGKKISVLIDQPAGKPVGLAFVVHGLSGFKEEPQIKVMAEAFLGAGYFVVRWDARDTFGESEGNFEDATVTSYYADLEDVVEWAKIQLWYQEPFILAGHSLGGICIGLYAEKYPEKVKALAPISTVVSGKLSLETPRHQREYAEWERTGWRITESASRPGIVKKLKWSHIEDRLKYDLLPDAGKLMMSVLLVVGENDESTPPAHQKILYDALPGRKELHIIKNSAHTFQQAPENLPELRTFFDSWIKKI